MITNRINSFAYQVGNGNVVWLIKERKIIIYAMDIGQMHFRCTKWFFEYQKKIFIKGRNKNRNIFQSNPKTNFKQILKLPKFYDAKSKINHWSKHLLTKKPKINHLIIVFQHYPLSPDLFLFILIPWRNTHLYFTQRHMEQIHLSWSNYKHFVIFKK